MLHKMANILKISWLRKLTFYVLCVCLATSCILFIRRYVISYNSPKDAYENAYRGTAHLIIEGDKSAYVLGSKDAHYFNRTNNGWKVPIFRISITKAIKTVDSKTIYVSQYNFSDEYYITIIDSQKGSLELKDNRNSIFYKIDNQENTKNANSCVYHAYINKFDEQYSIFVNDQEINLLE